MVMSLDAFIPKVHIPVENSRVISVEEMAEFLWKDWTEESVFFLDIETTGLDPFTCEVVTVQIRNEKGESWILKDPVTLEPIKDVLEFNKIVGHNIKFDSKFLKHHYGVTLFNVYDTYIAEVVISGGLLASRKGAALKDLVHRYCGVTLDKTEQTGFRRGLDLTESQEKYAINDLAYLPDIMRSQQEKINIAGMQSVINTEMKAIPAVVWLELSGMNIDMEKVKAIKAKLESQKAEAKQQLYIAFGSSKINLNSTQQLTKALNALKIPVETTAEEELSKYSHPVIDTLKTYKEAEKLLNTFVDKIPTYINKKTGRIHSDFNQIGAKSGRFTSSKPNLQQQPSKFTEWRSVYTASPGCKIVTADYSQIELRILGQVAGEPEYINAYKSGEDLHKLTASKIFKIDLKDVEKRQRSIAKTVNFGIAYGLGAGGLLRDLKSAGISATAKDAEDIISGYYHAYPKITEYLNYTSRFGLDHLGVRNKAGRVMKFEEPKDKMEAASIMRMSKNLPIQSLCADMIKDAMGNIFIRLHDKPVRFINTVHDELVMETDSDFAEEVAAIMKEEMEKAGKKYLIDMPCIAEPSISLQWEK